MQTPFHRLEIGDYFYFPPMSSKWIKEHEKEMNEIIGYSEPENKEIDLKSKPLFLLVEEFKNKIKKKAVKKWEYKYRFEVFKKISATKYEITDFGDPHKLYYPSGTKKPMVFDMYLPFMSVTKIEKEKLITNESCKENKAI